MVFECKNCKNKLAKWSVKCDLCNSVGTIEESLHQTKDIILKKLSDIEEQKVNFLRSIEEFDDVCGYGLPIKGAILITGEPGIGKSTMLLQICDKVRSPNPAVYITGEESSNQIKLRAKRLNVNLENIACASVACVETIISALNRHSASLVIIDSIQTIYSQSIESSPGSVVQIKSCALSLIDWVKNSDSSLILVGHVTKDGAIAGPKIIEHMVDIVLHFDGERGDNPLRILRTTKNRFGPTDTIGLFQITSDGLQPMQDVSRAFISERSESVVGISMLSSIDGNRVIMAEMQALISEAPMQSPRRICVGIENSRMHTIIAIIESKCRIMLGSKHVYCSVAGGLKITESAADLAIAISIISEAYKIPVSPFLASFGELSTSGEIRAVRKMNHRIKETLRLGFTTVLVPDGCKYDDDRVLSFKNISDIAQWLRKPALKKAKTNILD